MASRADDNPELELEGQWRTAGTRIQALLDALTTGGPVVRDRAEQLVREVVELYGAGLHRVVQLAGDPVVLDRLAADDLVASLLLVHGLHPHSVDRRVSDALDTVRPYLGSHGGDVELLEVTSGPEPTLRLRFTGSCKSCPSSAVTLELAVEDAVRAAAPEIGPIEVVTAEPGSPADPTVIPAENLLARLHSTGHTTTWHPAPDLAELTNGEVGGFEVDGQVVLACRVGDQVFAYRDHCPACDGSLAGAALHRRMGSPDPVLRCPRCHAHFDVVHAGAAADPGSDRHLEPVPLLVRDGILALAVAHEPTGVPA